MNPLKRVADPTCSLYVLEARDGDGPVYLKVGISKIPESRAMSIKTGCPIPMIAMRAVECPSVELARLLESAAHAALRAHGTCGEWFKLTDSSLAWDAILKLMDGKKWPIRDLDVANGYTAAKQRAQVKTARAEAARLEHMKKEWISRGFSPRARFG